MALSRPLELTAAALMRVLMPALRRSRGRGIVLFRGAACRPSLRRLSLLFPMALLASFYLHEVGQCVVAWVLGRPAIPTP